MEVYPWWCVPVPQIQIFVCCSPWFWQPVVYSVRMFYTVVFSNSFSLLWCHFMPTIDFWLNCIHFQHCIYFYACASGCILSIQPRSSIYSTGGHICTHFWDCRIYSCLFLLSARRNKLGMLELTMSWAIITSSMIFLKTGCCEIIYLQIVGLTGEESVADWMPFLWSSVSDILLPEHRCHCLQCDSSTAIWHNCGDSPHMDISHITSTCVGRYCW